MLFLSSFTEEGRFLLTERSSGWGLLNLFLMTHFLSPISVLWMYFHFALCWFFGVGFFFFLSVEHPEDSSENNRYIFSDSEEGCNESDFAVGKSCLSNVSYFYNLLYLLGHFSGFYKFPEDMKAGFIQEEGEHLTDFLICFKCWFKVN